MAQKKKLDLKELELQLPAIDSNETKIILGGNDYGDGNGQFDMWYWGGNGGSHGDGRNDDDHFAQEQDQGDLDHYYDDNNGEDWHVPDLFGGHDDDGHTNPGNNNSNLHDGIDVDKYDNLVIDTGNPAFDQAIEHLLESNSELATLLEDLLGDGTNQITFSVGDLGDDPSKYKMAETTKPDPNKPFSVYEITFNSHSFDQNGNYVFDATGNATDGTNMDALTPAQELAATIAHELLHIKYDEQVGNAYDQMIANQQNLDDLAKDLMNKYGEAFRDMYMEFDGNAWHWKDLTDPANDAQFGQQIHQYMHDHDYDFIQQVINEFKSDYP